MSILCISFADEDVSNVTAHIYGVITDIPIPFPFDKSDVCTDPEDGVNCPLHKDQEYHYTTSLFVEKKYPSVKWHLKFIF